MDASNPQQKVWHERCLVMLKSKHLKEKIT